MNNALPLPPPIRVMIVEDQGLVLAFLERWLTTLADFTAGGAARSTEEGLAVVAREKPDLAIVDLQLPGIDGLGFVRAARQIHPALRVIITSSVVDPLALTRIRDACVEGYIEKDTSPEELEAALISVAKGEFFFSERFRSILAREGTKAEAIGKILSRREQQVLAEVLRGKINKEVAEILTLSPRTVEFHRANLMAKLGVNNVAELIIAARKRGWSE